MMRQKRTKWLSAAIAAFAALSLVVGILPAPAYAVTQAEIDELERQKKKLEQQIEEKQAAVDELEKQHADATELKEALDERNALALAQLELVREQVQLYSQLIQEKEREAERVRFFFRAASRQDKTECQHCRD